MAEQADTTNTSRRRFLFSAPAAAVAVRAVKPEPVSEPFSLDMQLLFEWMRLTPDQKNQVLKELNLN